jgi:hypothetical protein
LNSGKVLILGQEWDPILKKETCSNGYVIIGKKNKLILID